MTDMPEGIWVTAEGTRWHVTPNCSGITDAREGNIERGAKIHPPIQRQPCRMCCADQVDFTASLHPHVAQLLQDAKLAVLTCKWAEEGQYASHLNHRFHGGCPVCQGDMDRVLSVAVQTVLNVLADRLKKVDPVEWALAGQQAGLVAADIVMNGEQP